jgi:sugar phosphate isomerase/epimerase
MGYDPVEEFNAYGMKISDIHIKDRKLHGGSVLLGTGDTNFKSFFTALSTIDYNGPFIMQVYRDEEGIAIFESQLNDFKNFLNYMI